jgi:hypothetical protein
MYYPIDDLIQLNRVSPELTRELAASSMSLALALHRFCRKSKAKIIDLPHDVQLQVESWQALLSRAQQTVVGLSRLPQKPHLSAVQVAEVFALQKSQL